MDIFIFGVVIAGLARLDRFKQFDAMKAVTFFMFLATFGILALIADMTYTYAYPRGFLLWTHPFVGAIALAYQAVFVEQQAKISRWRAFALVLPPWTAYFAFRILFFL